MKIILLPHSLTAAQRVMLFQGHSHRLRTTPSLPKILLFATHIHAALQATVWLPEVNGDDIITSYYPVWSPQNSFKQWKEPLVIPFSL